MNYQVGDLCKVIDQPPTEYFSLTGQVGFVFSITHIDLVTLCLLTQKGDVVGIFNVHWKFLEAENSPKWQQAKKLYDEKLKKHQDTASKALEAWKNKVKLICDKYSLSEEIVLGIHRELEGFEV